MTQGSAGDNKTCGTALSDLVDRSQSANAHAEVRGVQWVWQHLVCAFSQRFGDIQISDELGVIHFLTDK